TMHQHAFSCPIGTRMSVCQFEESVSYQGEFAMTSFRRMLASICLLAGLFIAPVHAETYHTCGTVIASLPTVISTQGVYCLTHDLATNITAGKAIDIQTNNVTIDCNGYKIGG